MGFQILTEKQAGGPIPKKIYDIYTWFQLTIDLDWDEKRSDWHALSVRIGRRGRWDQIIGGYRRDVDQPIKSL